MNISQYPISETAIHSSGSSCLGRLTYAQPIPTKIKIAPIPKVKIVTAAPKRKIISPKKNMNVQLMREIKIGTVSLLKLNFSGLIHPNATNKSVAKYE